MATRKVETLGRGKGANFGNRLPATTNRLGIVLSSLFVAIVTEFFVTLDRLREAARALLDERAAGKARSLTISVGAKGIPAFGVVVGVDSRRLDR